MRHSDKGPNRVRRHVPPIELPTWGTVRGRSIHLSCASEEEAMLTWGRFANTSTAREGELCAECQLPLSDVPQP